MQWYRILRPICHPLKLSSVVGHIPRSTGRNLWQRIIVDAMRRSEHDPTCDAFDEPPGAGILCIVLIAVCDFVDKYAFNFVACARFSGDDVIERQMNLLVGLRPTGVCDAIKAPEDEGDLAHACGQSGRFAERPKRNLLCRRSQWRVQPCVGGIDSGVEDITSKVTHKDRGTLMV